MPTLTRLVAAAEPATRELGPTSRLLSAALPAADPALRDLASTVSTAGPGLRATRRLLDATGPSSAAATKLLTDGLPDLDLARAYSPEVFGFFSGFMGQATTYDAVGHAVRGVPEPVDVRPRTSRWARTSSRPAGWPSRSPASRGRS